MPGPSGSAEQPAHDHTNAAATVAAEQVDPVRAAQRPSDQLRTLQECSDWLQALPHDVVSQIPPLQRVRLVTASLLRPSTSQQRKEIQAVLDDWDVLQKQQGHKRTFESVKQDLVPKVLKETNRLYTLHNASTAAIPGTADSPPWFKYSAIQAMLHRSQK